MSLVDIHGQLSSVDYELEKEAAVEYEKLAEEDAAGRIMARGFMAELHKIAQGLAPIGGGAETVKTKPYKTGPTGPAAPTRAWRPRAPKAEQPKKTVRMPGQNTGTKITPGGNLQTTRMPAMMLRSMRQKINPRQRSVRHGGLPRPK